jgi:hypothetical protein
MTLATIPTTDSKGIERSLARHIEEKTFRRIRRLSVATMGTRIVVQGVSPSYYVKQLALQAVRDLHTVLESLGLDMQDEIDVCQDQVVYANEWSLPD